ncbi:hypothetical protein AHAS_Ahas15G0250800 [Arachis hypogaea]
MLLTAAMWDPAADLIRTRANDDGENKGVNDNADFGGFDECIESESEKTVTQLCIEKRSGTKQLRNIIHVGDEVNGFLQGREAHKVSNNTKQLLGHSSNGLEKEYWRDGLLSGVHMFRVGEAQGELSGVELQQGDEQEAGLGSLRARGSGPGDHDETSQDLERGVEDGPGQLRARGSGSKKEGRADQQHRRGSGQGQLPPCTPGSKMYEGGTQPGAFSMRLAARRLPWWMGWITGKARVPLRRGEALPTVLAGKQRTIALSWYSTPVKELGERWDENRRLLLMMNRKWIVWLKK